MSNNSVCVHNSTGNLEKWRNSLYQVVSNLINIPETVYLPYHLSVCAPVRSAPSSIIDKIKSFKIKSLV